jgi:serine/threonine-protein kinase RsbT
MNDARSTGSGRSSPLVVVKPRLRSALREGRASLVSLSRDGMRVPVNTDRDILTAREKGQALAAQLGFSSSDATLIAFVISELTRDILFSRRRGEIVLSVLNQQGRTGLMVTSRAKESAFAGAAKTGPCARAWDPGMEQRLPELGGLVDELIIASNEDLGTTVTVKKWRR